MDGDDTVLALRVTRGGDAAAEAELCRRLVPRIRAYGLRHLRDHAAAADLAQHVAIAVIEALRAGRVEEPARLASFVMGVCRNTVLDHKRGERRRGALLERFGASFETETAPPAPVDRTRLGDCLARLAERERTIIVLTFYADRDGDEIARELAMSPGNVRVARHRALTSLHACMGEAA